MQILLPRPAMRSPSQCPGDGSVFDFSRLANREHVPDDSFRFLRLLRASHPAPRPQVSDELLLQQATRLDEQRLPADGSSFAALRSNRSLPPLSTPPAPGDRLSRIDDHDPAAPTTAMPAARRPPLWNRRRPRPPDARSRAPLGRGATTMRRRPQRLLCAARDWRGPSISRTRRIRQPGRLAVYRVLKSGAYAVQFLDVSPSTFRGLRASKLNGVSTTFQPPVSGAPVPAVHPWPGTSAHAHAASPSCTPRATQSTSPEKAAMRWFGKNPSHSGHERLPLDLPR